MTPDHIPESQTENRSTAGMTTKVVKGSFWTLVGQILPLLVSFVATPFVIRFLGAEGYGVLALVALIPGYLNFADLGMGMASTKFGSEAYASGDGQAEARVVRTAALIALIASIPLGFVIFVFSGQIVEIFNVPVHLQAESTLALKLASIMLSVNFLNSIINTPQLARLRMDMNTLVVSGFRILGVIATPIVLYFGGGISGAILVLLCANILTLVGHLYVSGKLLPSLYGFSIDRLRISPLLRMGSPWALSAIAGVLLANSEKLVLARITSVETLAYYSVAFTFANMATMFSGSMVQSLVPAFSQLFAPEKRDQLNSLFARSLRVNIFGLLPLLTFLAIVGRPFFSIWAGADFGRESTWPFYVLLIGLFFNLNAYVSSSLILSSGRTDILAKMYWIELIPYLLLSIFLTIQFGAVGAAMAWSMRVTIDFLISFVLAKKIGMVDFSIFENRDVLLVGFLVFSPPLVFSLISETLSYWLVFVFVACVVLYVLMIWRFLATADEKQLISGLFRTTLGLIKNS